MTVYKCICDTTDIHISDCRFLSIMSQNYELFRKLQIKSAFFAKKIYTQVQLLLYRVSQFGTCKSLWGSSATSSQADSTTDV